MIGGEYGLTHRAIVRGITDDGVTVEIPSLAPNAPWGPIPTCVPDLAVGEAVLVTQISTSRDTVVVVGRVPGRAPTVAEILTLASTLASLQAADTALDGRLDTVEADLNTAEATLAAHTHITAPSMAVAGNATVGGTLGVTGATTLGTVTAGAIAGSAVAVSGDATAQGGTVFTELREAAAHGISGTKIRVVDTTVHNRSARQPVVHNGLSAAVGIIVGSAVTFLSSFTWFQRETGNASMVATVVAECDPAVHGDIGQSKLRWRLVRVSTGALLAEQDYFYLSAQAGRNGVASIATATLVGAPDVVLTAGVGYRFEIHGIEDPPDYTLDITVRDIYWLVTECVRAT